MKHALFVLFSVLAFQTMAQQNILIEETFDHNNGRWPERHTELEYAAVDSGEYRLAHLSTRGYAVFTTNQYLDPEKDFLIQATMRQDSGHDASAYGISWGGRGYGFFHYFAISQSGYFKVGKVWKDKQNTVQDWSKVRLHRTGLSNELKVTKRGSKMHFYINEREVYTCDFVDYYGSEIGFFLDEDKLIAVEDFIVRHPPVPIFLPDSVERGYKKQLLDTFINTASDELAPVITPDGSRLYFCRNDHPDNIAGSGFFDIWYTERQTNGSWGPPKNIGKPLNNHSSNWVISVTPDGNTLLLSGTYKPDGSYKGPGISMAHRTKEGWDIPTEVEIEDFYTWNRYASYYLSNDLQWLILAVERNDSYGDQDLYFCKRKEDGNYSRPKNMGPDINTFSVESAPFLAADNRTLYFGSMGRPGYGSADIYMSKRLDGSWTRWSEPVNLGPELNDASWNNYYTIPASGEAAFMVQSDLATYNEDLIQIELADPLKPDPVVLVKGRVLNSKDSLPLEADITYTDLSVNLEMGYATSDPMDGSFALTLPFGIEYGFYAARQGYYPISQSIDLRDLSEYTEVEADLYLTPIEVGQPIRLNNIFFDFDKATLRKESHDELQRLSEFLEANPSMVIEIAGHTDAKGSDSYNLDLSQRRAETVSEYLIQKCNVSKDRLKPKGYGESEPIMPNDIEEGRAFNRRVEFTVLEMER